MERVRVINRVTYPGVLCECLLETCPYGVPVTWGFNNILMDIRDQLDLNVRVMLPDHVCLHEKVIFECDTFLITQDLEVIYD